MRFRLAGVVLALAAAVAIGQVPMYSDYPWGLLQSGVDKGPVWNLNCIPPLTCDTTAYGNGRIQLGDGGTSGLTLDDIVDGVTFGRPRLSGLTGGYVTLLQRSGINYATSTFLNSGLDTLDNLGDGASFARVSKTSLDGGSVLLDATLEGAFGKVSRAKLDGGSVVLDLTLDGTYSKTLAAGLTAGYVSKLDRGGSQYSTSTFFNTGLDTLDNVSEGTTFGKVNRGKLDGGAVVLDLALDGLYSKTLAAGITSGYVSSLSRGGASYSTNAFFNTSLDTLDNVGDGTTTARVAKAKLDGGSVVLDLTLDGTFAKVLTSALDAGYVTTVKRSGLTEPVENLFKKGSDTFSSVAGQLGSGQLAAGSVDTPSLQDLVVTAGKLNDGIPLAAYDEAGPAGIFSRSSTSSCTKQATYTDGDPAYIRFTYVAGALTAQVSTGLYTGTSTNLFTTKAVVRYRINTTTPDKLTSLTAVNTGNTAQTATTIWSADGAWHTAVFDLSAWTTPGALRLDLAAGSSSAAGSIDLAYAGTGNPASGTGALVSYQGRVGVNTASPSTRLEVSGAHVSARGLMCLNSTATNLAALTFYPEGNYAGAVYGDTDDSLRLGTVGATPVHVYTNNTNNIRLTVGANGNVSIAAPTSGNALSAAGVIESTASGYKFPDASTQTTSAGTFARATGDFSRSATTYADVTGMALTVTSGVTYEFEAYLIWQSAATTTGPGFSVNGPTNTLLDYVVEYQTNANATAGTLSARHDTAYDAMAALTTTTAATTSYVARIRGVLTPSANGTLAVRLRSSNATAVTIKAGSYLKLRPAST